MTKEEKIQAIYDKISDKTLSEWCLVELWEWEIIKINRVQKIATLDKIYHFMYSDFTNSNSYLKETEFPNMNIIWHKVKIWDVLDYQYYNSKHSNITEERLKIIWLWGKCRNSIEEQSEECIDYVFNLLPKE